MSTEIPPTTAPEASSPEAPPDETYAERHERLARYRIYYFNPMLPRGRQKKEIERGLALKQAEARRDELNAELKARGQSRFMDPSYGFELTNSWECMTDAARERHLALGGKPGDRDR